MATKRLRTALFILLGICLFFALVLGVVVGVALASTRNMMAIENFQDFNPALPSRIVDIQGRLITEFSSTEKRELISVTELPQHLIDAFIVREDRDFWTHPGFKLRGYARAAVGVLTKRNLGGGSTITLQLAGLLYLDRTERSYTRKLRELWYALQLERRFTKLEILEMYLNLVHMGPSVYGVEAASKYYFGHSASEATVAESAILAIQMSSPTHRNPITNPNTARNLSGRLLENMVELGYIDAQEADESFVAYWDNFDYTRVSVSSFFMREDKAPWFSEHVRRELEGMLYGSIDLHRDGLTVHTTLNLDYQAAADRYMQRYLTQVNTQFARTSTQRWAEAERLYAPLSELIGLAFNLEGLFFQEEKLRSNVMNYYRNNINPLADALALMFGLDGLKQATNAGFQAMQQQLERTTVEGALITLDNETGYITAMVGGSRFGQDSQWNRATQSQLMPGSVFKPLYYSAAIDSRSITMGSLIYDAPIVFYNEDGTPYIPLNYRGEWRGQVLAWYALARSMNVPAVKVLDTIGFDAAINRSAALLDIQDPAQIRRTFPRVYPLALGVIGVSPLRMARAYAVFANQGREVQPIAIRSVEDRNGRVILEPEKELRTQQKRKGTGIQVVSPENAFIMTKMLQEVIRDGTLTWSTQQGRIFTYRDENGRSFTIPSAAKTGTTQNWADAWTVGYTPHMTTAIWFGFDKAGNSLGVDQSGAAIAGAAWSNYMSDIHNGLPFKDFVRPQSGLVDVRVCAVSGLLPTEFCDEGTVLLTFYEGTQPQQYCDLHQFKSRHAEETIRSLQGQGTAFGSLNLDPNLGADLSDLEALLQSLLKESQTQGGEGSQAQPGIQFDWTLPPAGTPDNLEDNPSDPDWWLEDEDPEAVDESHDPSILD